jgi:hypothetical protein
MIGQDVMIAAEVDNRGVLEKVIVRGNFQQCYHHNCQHRSVNGVGMLGHLQTAHRKRNPADMGIWDIIIEHLEHEVIICKHPGCGFVAITEKAMLAHNTHQHRAEAQWTTAPLTAHLGVAAPSELSEDPIKEFNDISSEFFKRKNLTLQEAEELGRNFFLQAFRDWEKGVKEKHLTHAEVKLVNEEGSFPKMIEEDVVPFYEQFKNCSFDAKEGYFEMAFQVMRAKLRALRKAGESLYGPKQVVTVKEIERRKVVAENARLVYEILKSTQLVLEALNWRTTDKRLQATEYELSGISIDDSRVKFERERMFNILKKCIRKLSKNIQPYSPEKAQPVIGLLRNGKRRPVKIHYGLEGEPVEDLLPEPQADDTSTRIQEDEAHDLFFLCEISEEQLDAITEETWDQVNDSQVYRTCLAIRGRAFSGTLPNLSDSKKQQMLNEIQKLKDNNDWTMDPKNVYRRSVLRKKAPSSAESTDRMEDTIVQFGIHRH